MPVRIRTNTAIATAVLAIAFALALAAQWFYRAGMVIAGIGSAAVALLTCCIVLILCAPQVFRWGHEKRARWPWLSRLTGEGLVFFPALVFIAAAAIISGNNLMFLILSVMLAAMMLSGVVSRLSLAELYVRVFAEQHVFAGKWFDVEVRIKNLKTWMASYSLQLRPHIQAADQGIEFSSVYCPLIPGGEEVLTRIACRFSKRGVYTSPAFVLATKFPFSVIERRLRVQLRREVVVYPRIDASIGDEDYLKALEQHTQPTVGTSHDLFRIRPAMAADGARFVDWKASARSDELHVKEFNKLDQHNVEVIFDRYTARGQEAEFEAAVDRCATLLHNLWERGANVQFRCGNFENAVAPGSDRIYTSMHFLAGVEPDLDSSSGPADATDALVIGVAHPSTPTAGELPVATVQS